MATRRSPSTDRSYRARPRGLRPALPQPEVMRAFRWPNAFGSVPLPSVSEGSALGLPALYRGINLIANGVASMAPPRVVAADLVTELDTPPIVSRPNANYGTFEFWHMACAHAITTGNFVAVLADFDSFTGWPRQVIPVPSSAIDCHYNPATGFVEYAIGGFVLGADDVVHVRGFTIPGNPWGIGLVENFRRSIGAQLSEQNLVASTYNDSAVPSGIVTVKRPEITKDQADFVADQWTSAHAGNRTPAVFPETYEFTPISWSPQDAQFLEARQLSVAEAAFMLNLDPSDLGASVGGTALTYANITDRNAVRLQESYGPWVARFEDAWTDAVPGGQTVRFRRENLKHADRKALFEEQKVGIEAGVLSRDEARAEQNKKPLPSTEVATQEVPSAVPGQ